MNPDISAANNNSKCQSLLSETGDNGTMLPLPITAPSSLTARVQSAAGKRQHPPWKKPIDKALLEQLLAAHHWPYSAIEDQSPRQIVLPCHEHYKLLLRLFEEGDFLWIAYGLGQNNRRTCDCFFNYAARWFNYSVPPGLLICPNPLKPGTHSRASQNILEKKYLVLASEGLSDDEMGAVFQWMMQQGHTLRAVVHSSKSGLNGWFDYPEDNDISPLKRTLAPLGFNPQLFDPSHPCALACGKWEGQYNKLIYFNP